MKGTAVSAATFSKIRRVLGTLPPPSEHHPVTDALERARSLGEGQLTSVLQGLASMPQSTMILANPPLYDVSVRCEGAEIHLKIRSFGIRGLLHEEEIARGDIDPVGLIFVGLFGRRPEARSGEASVLGALIDRAFHRSFFAGRGEEPSPLLLEVAEFVRRFPARGPGLTIHHVSTLRKASVLGRRGRERGINDERRPAALLVQMIRTHMENVAAGAATIHMNALLRGETGLGAGQLAERTCRFVASERRRSAGAFPAIYGLVLGGAESEEQRRVLERMGTIQTHHGSAGSNMVARYAASLHVRSVSDFLVASQVILDGDRHFGAIHDMTAFVARLERTAPGRVDDVIREAVAGGGLPTFGHPEIAAAGRSREIQQDPRPALYLIPLFEVLDAKHLTLDAGQKRRLSLAQRMYQIAFVEGVVKPGRDDREPLRLTPNTDFGAWCVQEALGIQEVDRTFLTYVFRGFGWIMDAREQLQQKIIRPVIAADPSIVPRATGDQTIPTQVVELHRRLCEPSAFR